MSTLIIVYLALVATFGGLMYFLARSVRTVLAYAIIATLSFFALASTLGRPAPIRFAAEGEVVARYIEPGAAIYLWIMEDGRPRAFYMPWDADRAANLETVMRVYRRGFFKPLTRETHPPPQPPHPLKQPED